MLFFWLYALTYLKILSDGFLLNIHLLISWKWTHSARSLRSLSHPPTIILLLPVFREQKHLQQAIHSLGLLTYPGQKRIVIVTTEREVIENGGTVDGTTVEVAKRICRARQSDQDLYEHIHYPHAVGNKASQLNYALREICQSPISLSATYIGVYDVDSQPHPETLLSLVDLLAREEQRGSPWPIAIQQPSLFFGNMNDVSWYLQLEALFETRWVLGHEIRTLRASTRPSAKYLAPYTYCVGHGMFLRADFLKGSGGFPEPSEDVPLGHRLNFLAIPIHPLPVFDVADVAPRVPTLIRQSGFWFCNALLIWKEYFHLRKAHVPVSTYRSTLLLIKGLLDLFSWVHYPLHFLALSALVLTHHPLYAVLSLAGVYFDAGLGMLLMSRFLPGANMPPGKQATALNIVTFLSLLLAAPIRNIVRGCAPILAGWYFLQILLLKRTNVFPKTKR